MESLLAQTFSDWELVVCDSYSDDGSWEFFQKFAGDRRVQLHQVPREGVYAGWNECLKRARGELVYFATSDDTAEPRLLERLHGMLAGNASTRLATCAVTRIDEAGRELELGPSPGRVFLGEWCNLAHVRSGLAEFLLNVCFGPVWESMTGVLFRRDLLEATGFFKTDQGSLGDADWALRVSLETDLAYTPEALATWRIHSSQASRMVWETGPRRTMLRSLRGVIRDCEGKLPAAWRQRRDWRQRLLAPRVEACRELYLLQRWNARTGPREFLGRFREALSHDTVWALGKMLRGFPGGSELDYDLQAGAKALFETFPAEWPPTRVDWEAGSAGAGVQQGAP